MQAWEHASARRGQTSPQRPRRFGRAERRRRGRPSICPGTSQTPRPAKNGHSIITSSQMLSFTSVTTNTNITHKLLSISHKALQGFAKRVTQPSRAALACFSPELPSGPLAGMLTCTQTMPGCAICRAKCRKLDATATVRNVGALQQRLLAFKTLVTTPHTTLAFNPPARLVRPLRHTVL